MKYVALLRGINVGGNSIVPMSDLRARFEELGFTNVRTYIQSGNVVFESKVRSSTTLSEKVTEGLASGLSCKPPALVLSDREMAQVVTGAPAGFGAEPEAYRCDVIFMMPTLTVREALGAVTANPEVDEVYEGTRVVYFRRLVARATKSRLSKLASHPLYKSMTVRNWNTTFQLHKLLRA